MRLLQDNESGEMEFDTQVEYARELRKIVQGRR